MRTSLASRIWGELMFKINSDRSIYVTRGDIVFFNVSATYNGSKYRFRTGEVLRILIYGKKDCSKLLMRKDFEIEKDADMVSISLTKDETKLGNIISKPTDLWYEIVLNPDTNPQTIVGYNDEGPAVFRLYPEGKDFDDGDNGLANEILKGELLTTIEKIVEQVIKEQYFDTKIEEVLKEYIEQNPTIKGEDGEDGLTPYVGENGNWWIGITDTGESASGIAPKLRIESVNHEWEVSYDDGNTWQPLGVKAKGEDGKDGQDGKTPEKGKDYYTEADKQEMSDTVIQYINNHPEKVTIGASSFVVAFENVNGTWKADKTFAAVKAAITKGDVVVCDYVANGNSGRGELYIHDDTMIGFVWHYFTGIDTYFNLKADESVVVFEGAAVDNSAAMPISIVTTKDDKTITVSAIYGDATTSVSTITLDDDGFPVGVTKDGKDCALAWGGFD